MANTLFSQIRSEMRIIDRAILIGVDGEADPYAESEWEKIKRDIIDLARSVEMQTHCIKAMNRAEKKAIKTGQDVEAARQAACYEAEQEFNRIRGGGN